MLTWLMVFFVCMVPGVVMGLLTHGLVFRSFALAGWRKVDWGNATVLSVLWALVVFLFLSCYVLATR